MNPLKQSITSGLLILIVSLLLPACSKTPETETAAVNPERVLTVYKSPTCGCCSKWAAHMEEAGFHLNIKEYQNFDSIKRRYQITQAVQSCHTAISESTGYVFEGHIPAHLIKRFIDEKPVNAIGLALPGMPMGSPGMEYEGKHMPYDVLVLMKDGSTQVFQHVDHHSS